MASAQLCPLRIPRKLAVAVVVLLVLNAAAWYQLAVRARRPPSFDRGGRFAVATRPATVEGITTTTTASPTTAAAVAPAPTSTTVAAPANSYAPGHVSAVATGVAASPGVLPPLGTYRWRVSGTEAACGFGSRAF